MKKLFLLLAVASLALTSCEDRVDPRISAVSLANAVSDRDSIVVIDKCMVASCTKIVADTFKYVDCDGTITKRCKIDTIKIKGNNYIFYKRIGNTNIEKIAVAPSVFHSTHKGDTTNYYSLWLEGRAVNPSVPIVHIGDGSVSN